MSYFACNRFSGDDRGVCDKLHRMGRWLKEKDGLDMQPIIDTLLKPDKTKYIDLVRISKYRRSF